MKEKTYNNFKHFMERRHREEIPRFLSDDDDTVFTKTVTEMDEHETTTLLTV